MVYTIRLPGRAADEFDGGEIGQRVAHGGSPDPGDEEIFAAWAGARSVRAGLGSQRVVTGSREVFEEILVSMDALEIACDQGEDPSGARACRVAAERIRREVGV